MNVNLRRRLLIIAGVLTGILVFGTTGYVLIEGYSPFDAFYMALTTITTIGYGEIFGLSRRGRIFNSAYILVGVTSLLLAIGALTQTILELELSGYFPKRRAKRMVDSLKDHVIVCGFGRVGRGACHELKRMGTAFVVVDKSEQRVEQAMRSGMLAVLADCTRDETLREVQIHQARGLIASLSTDADNLFIVISAKQLNSKLHVCTRVTEEESEQKMRRAGADEVYAPYQITGSRLAQAIVRPHVQQFLDFTTINPDLPISIEQVRVPPGGPLVDRTLADASLRKDLGIIVLAIRRASGVMLFNPDADAMISAGDHLIVMGPDDGLRTLERRLS